jgi:hypothetical protein
MKISDKGKELIDVVTCLLSQYCDTGTESDGKAYLSAKADLLQYIADLESKAKAWDDLPETIFLPGGGKE